MHFDPASYLGGGERYPLNLARGLIEASDGGCNVDLISYGEYPAERTLSPGLTLRVLPLANPVPNPLDSLSWELPAALSQADVVHVHQIFTRSSEVAVLAAKLLRKPVCVTDHGGANSSLGASYGMLSVADRVQCYSNFAASLLRTPTPVEV
ncbi:MAG: glycosyltransferase family 4 protein, partial [Actinomycetota bacterium]|nr:glycosyltransferase family 4 protein [Actinomycetota bacterium]